MKASLTMGAFNISVVKFGMLLLFFMSNKLHCADIDLN
ncbi:putative membrane protein [Escherichia coli 5905]|nr:putative membrane protein [Escherichia coli 5905]